MPHAVAEAEVVLSPYNDLLYQCQSALKKPTGQFYKGEAEVQAVVYCRLIGGFVTIGISFQGSTRLYRWESFNTLNLRLAFQAMLALNRFETITPFLPSLILARWISNGQDETLEAEIGQEAVAAIRLARPPEVDRVLEFAKQQHGTILSDGLTHTPSRFSREELAEFARKAIRN